MTIREAAQALMDAVTASDDADDDADHAALYFAMLEARNALRAELAKGDWQPIETAPKGRKLIVGYLNRANKWRTVMACYYEPQTLESEETESGYADEGWYEESEVHEEILLCDCEPTHWMPLPPAPDVLAAREGR